MAKALDLSLLTTKYRVNLLKASAPLKATESYRELGISQASFSRLVEKMGPALLSIGRARRRKYALRKKIPTVGDRISIYLITEKGRPIHWAILHFLEPKGFYLEPKQALMSDAVFLDLPYFLDDMRPAGFLGRLIPKLHPELEAPVSILDWSAPDCLRYWVSAGLDLPGNFILGENAIRRFMESKVTRKFSKEQKSYVEAARSVILHGVAGSSAGGEQPKFLARASVAYLVKFSPPVTDKLSRRVADLLISEHIAHNVLSQHGFKAVRSRVKRQEKQLFLEIERFDRVGDRGRKGVISLMALSMEFVGILNSWSAIGRELLRQKLIQAKDYSNIVELELFGKLIGNTDMHPGNFSFFIDESLNITGPAPVYDMLPMMYYPRQNQLLDQPFEVSLPLPEETELWSKACELALKFWEKVSDSPDISSDFKAIALANRKVLQKAKMSLKT